MKLSAYDCAGRRKYLNRQENSKFREAVALQPPDRMAFCLTIYFTGCRISEALALTENEVEWETNVIRFQTLKKRAKTVVRRIPIPENLSAMLKDIATGDPKNSLWSFSRTTGWRIIKNTMRQAEIEGVQATAKGLRHGFGVRGAVESIPINLLRDWMGHADISTTMIYLDIADDEELELIQRTW